MSESQREILAGSRNIALTAYLLPLRAVVAKSMIMSKIILHSDAASSYEIVTPARSPLNASALQLLPMHQ